MDSFDSISQGVADRLATEDIPVLIIYNVLQKLKQEEQHIETALLDTEAKIERTVPSSKEYRILMIEFHALKNKLESLQRSYTQLKIEEHHVMKHLRDGTDYTHNRVEGNMKVELERYRKTIANKILLTKDLKRLTSGQITEVSNAIKKLQATEPGYYN